MYLNGLEQGIVAVLCLFSIGWSIGRLIGFIGAFFKWQRLHGKQYWD